MVKIFLILFLICANTSWAVFEHYNAYKAYKNNNFEAAAHHLDTLLTHNPDDYESLYNAGKVAYKQQNFSKAETYFAKATKTSNNTLQEKAYYDKGNSQIHQQKLLEAKKSFEEVLRINPHNEPAQKTLEYIKKALEEQKKKQEQQKQNEQQKKDQKNQEQQDQNKENQSQENQQDQKNQERNQEQQRDEHDKQQQEQNNQDTQQDPSQQNQQDQQEKNEQEKEEQEQSDQDSNNQQDKQQNSKNDDSSHQQNDPTEQSSQQEKENVDAQSEEQESSAGEQLDKQSSPADSIKKDKATLLLEKLEKEDAQNAKKLLKYQVNKEKQKNNGYKNW